MIHHKASYKLTAKDNSPLVELFNKCQNNKRRNHLRNIKIENAEFQGTDLLISFECCNETEKDYREDKFNKECTLFRWANKRGIYTIDISEV